MPWPFVDPSSPDYPFFVNQLLPPQPLPDLVPPPNTPPQLDTTDPGDDPGTAVGDDWGGSDAGDMMDGGGSSAPGDDCGLCLMDE